MTRKRWAWRCRALAQEDPSFRVHTDEESGQTIISGMGELHLEIIVDRMKREFKVEANVGAPRVAYRERFAAPPTPEGKFVRQSGRSRSVRSRVAEDRAAGSGQGYEFVNAIVGGVVPKEYTSRRSTRASRRPCRVVLLPVTRWSTSRSPLRRLVPRSGLERNAFKIAGRWVSGRRTEGQAGHSREPMMKVEVETPEDYMGDVIGDLNSRRGMVQGMEDGPSGKMVKAEVPLSERCSAIRLRCARDPGSCLVQYGIRQIQ